MSLEKLLKPKLHLFLLLTLFSALLLHCRKRDSMRPRWDMDIITPIINTSLSLGDLVSDTLFTTGADNSLKIVHRELLYTFGLDSLIGLSVEPFETRKGVESLELASDTISYSVTIGQLAREMKEDGNPMGDVILNSHGSSTYVFRTSNLSAGPFYVNISDVLKEAEIRSGELQIVIDNGFPVDLENLNFEVRNFQRQDIIVDTSIALVQKNSRSDTLRKNLAGKTIEGIMEINIPNFGIGPGFVEIDTNDAITATIIVKNVKVQQATAVFPAQDIIDNEENAALEDMGEVRLTKAILKSGKIRMFAETTAQDTIYFTYSIPVATLNGVPFIIHDKIPPAPAGGTSSKSLEYDFAGYEIDLTGKNRDTINAIYNRIIARIQYTGKEVTLGLNDFVDVRLSFDGVQPSYIEGFLGKDTIEVGPAETAFDFLDFIKADRLEFKEVILSMDIDNGLGASGEFNINKIYAKNSTETKTILNPASGEIRKAEANPLQAVTTNIPVNSTNPSPADLLSIQPETIGFEGVVYLNKNTSSSDLSGFAYDNSKMNAFLNVEVPMNFITENLVLSDTIRLPETRINVPIEQGELNILAWNMYPLDARVKVYFYNELGHRTDSLISGNDILGATIDPVSGRTSEKKYSKVSYQLSVSRLEKMLKSDKAIVEVRFFTTPANNHVKIFSDYSIDLKLAGDFNYTVRSR